ncbi:MAG: PTS sugar transporter subunit IIA, partial [Erysipelotrichaceae bacterium]|nr:PTS sugar transporter subunit IIA [Erysipelotrichaceae bacterium]
KKREDISSTVIGEIIALPHPLGDCVIENSIFSVIAPKGIRWDDKVVKFVFVFAIKNQDSENIQILYEQMLDFISSDQLQYELLKNPSFSSLSNFFSQHSYK